MRFFVSTVDAEGAGLRPCRRCRPRDEAGTAEAQVRHISGLCEYIRRHADESLTLQRLGREVGLSPAHLQRRFKAAVGVTPRQYQEGLRVQTFKHELRGGMPVTEAIFEAGFGATSRVYARADSTLGMTPVQYRSGGKSVEISYVSWDGPLGRVMVGATDRGLCFVQFGDTDEALRAALQTEYPQATLSEMTRPYPAQFSAWVEGLARHLREGAPHPDLPLDLQATAFQLRVWRYLQSIPPGEVRPYAEVAAGIGSPTATRAVARACAANRVAVLIPCHRVIRSDGGLGGFRWGLGRKQALLRLERGEG